MHVRLKQMAAIVVSLGLLGGGCRVVEEGGRGGDRFAKHEQAYTFVQDGRIRFRLVLPGRPAEEERVAADLIQRVFREICGREPGIVHGAALPSGRLDIHIGRTVLAKQLDVLPVGTDEDGFAVCPNGPEQLLLVGGRPVGTFYAATEFLERYAGVLWVWPGEHGTVIPKTDELVATVRRQVSEPAFTARQYSGVGKAEMRLFRIHQTSRELRSSFHHNVWKVLTEDLYEPHPEYFSLVDGERRRPTANKSNWQACTSNPEVVKLFIEAAREQFEEKPWVRAFSVSQNDGQGFCECENCRALDVPGEEGVTDRYFTFVNAVADGIREDYPDKLVSCFAYGRKGTANVPVKVKLRPNTLIYAVVPTLVDHHKTIRQWSKAAPNLGAYFWLHGKTVPKFYPHRWAEYLRFLHRHNVREIYAEAYPDWEKLHASWELDGPRIWITSKLLWDPDADVDVLMTGFCRRFYGAAAEPMLRYYQQCEVAWERQEDPFDFGEKWTDPDFGLYCTDDVKIMETCVQDALALAAYDKEALARLEALNRVFAPVAAHVRQLDLCRVLAANPLTKRVDAEQAVEAVHAVELGYLAALKEKRLLFGAMPNQTETAIDACFSRITNVLGVDASAFWDAAVTAQPELERFINAQLQGIRGELKNIAVNPSLEEQRPAPSEEDKTLNWRSLDAPGWKEWVRPGSAGTVGVATDVARTGTKSLVLTGAEMACGIYTQDAEPGERYRVSCWAKTTVQPDPDADSPPVGGKLTFKWQTAEGKWVSGPPPMSIPLPSGTSQWQRLVGVVAIPEGVGKLVILLGVEQQKGDEKTWFDDLCVQKLGDSPR